MDKLVRALFTVVLSGLVLVAIAGPAIAAPPGDYSTTACWNNCTGGGSSK